MARRTVVETQVPVVTPAKTRSSRLRTTSSSQEPSSTFRESARPEGDRGPDGLSETLVSTFKPCPDLRKRCDSDNGWTFGDGFQTLPKPSKPLLYKGSRAPARPTRSCRSRRSAPPPRPNPTLKRPRDGFQTLPWPPTCHRHRRRHAQCSDDSRPPTPTTSPGATPADDRSTTWPAPTASTGQRSSGISTGAVCPAGAWSGR